MSGKTLLAFIFFAILFGGGIVYLIMKDRQPEMTNIPQANNDSLFAIIRHRDSVDIRTLRDQNRSAFSEISRLNRVVYEQNIRINNLSLSELLTLQDSIIAVYRTRDSTDTNR